MRRNRAVPFCLFFFGGLTVPVTRGWGRQIEHTEKSRTLRARRGELGQKGNRPLRHRSPTHFPSVFTLIAVKRKDWKGRRQPKRERKKTSGTTTEEPVSRGSASLRSRHYRKRQKSRLAESSARNRAGGGSRRRRRRKSHCSKRPSESQRMKPGERRKGRAKRTKKGKQDTSQSKTEVVQFSKSGRSKSSGRSAREKCVRWPAVSPEVGSNTDASDN